ncbi:MAG: restriction endonuclease subunit S [Acidobacteriota bacterium]
MNTLPEGWTLATLGEMCTKPQYGWTSSATKSGKIRLLRTSDISNGLEDWDSVPFCQTPPANLEKYRIAPNDILVSRAGSVGISHRVRRAPVDAVFASYLIRFKALKDVVLPQYLEFYLKSDSYWSFISESSVGIAVPNVNATKLANLEIPLASVAEQRRIVAKLRQLLARVEACQKRLARIPVILKRFRQSVLATACSGQLTADWREQNPHTEPAFIQLDEARQSTTNEFPESWMSVGVGLVIDTLKYGTAQKCGYEKEGVSVLRIPNIADGVIDHSDVKYALLPEREFEQLRLVPGDVLLIRSNGSVSLVGKSALIRKPEKGFAYAGYLIRLRPNRSRVLPEYLNLALSSYDVRLQIEIPARSTSGVHNINSEEVRGLRISLPPLTEQSEIVRRVEALFKLADQIEGGYRKAQAHVDKLTQSILAKAFRGELVPTEAELARREGRDYEPASVLLESIRTGRSNEAAAPPTARANRFQERRLSKGAGRRK